MSEWCSSPRWCWWCWRWRMQLLLLPCSWFLCASPPAAGLDAPLPAAPPRRTAAWSSGCSLLWAWRTAAGTSSNKSDQTRLQNTLIVLSLSVLLLIININLCCILQYVAKGMQSPRCFYGKAVRMIPTFAGFFSTPAVEERPAMNITPHTHQAYIFTYTSVNLKLGNAKELWLTYH